jgi:hypothetical protein
MSAHAKKPTVIVLDRARRVVSKKSESVETPEMNNTQRRAQEARQKVLSRLKRLHPMD